MRIFLAGATGAIGRRRVSEDDGAVRIAKARATLGFDPAFRAPA